MAAETPVCALVDLTSRHYATEPDTRQGRLKIKEHRGLHEQWSDSTLSDPRAGLATDGNAVSRR